MQETILLLVGARLDAATAWDSLIDTALNGTRQALKASVTNAGLFTNLTNLDMQLSFTIRCKMHFNSEISAVRKRRAIWS